MNPSRTIRVVIYIFMSMLSYNCAAPDYYKQPKRIYVEYANSYKLTGNDKFLGKDSTVIVRFADGKIKSVGKFAMSVDNHLSRFKVGKWIEYNSNGTIKETGNYRIGRFYDCGPGGLAQVYYNYKSGFWQYFAPDGSKRASGKYNATRCHINTRCGGTDLNWGLTNDHWKFYNDGKRLLIDYEKTICLPDEFGYITFMYYDRVKKTVIVDELTPKIKPKIK